MNVEFAPRGAGTRAERPFEIDWWPNRIVFQSGAVDRLGELLAQLGRRRALIVCGNSIAARTVLDRVKSALGPSCAGAFTADRDAFAAAGPRARRPGGARGRC